LPDADEALTGLREFEDCIVRVHRVRAVEVDALPGQVLDDGCAAGGVVDGGKGGRIAGHCTVLVSRGIGRRG